MKERTIGIGYTCLGALGLLASLSQPAHAADVFNAEIPVPRDCEERQIDAIVGDDNFGRGIGVACNRTIDVLAEASQDLADTGLDFSVQALIRSNGRLIIGLSDDTAGDGPEANFVNDPGGNLSVQLVVSVF